VDAVEEVITVQGEEFQQVLPPGNREALGYLSGILRRDDRLVLWVDPLGLAPEGLSALEAAAA
jgi:chemotaxis signal transduction protein